MSGEPRTSTPVAPALPGAARTETSFATVGLVVVAVGVLYFGQEVFVPLALAILLSFVLTPLAARLRRLHVGRVPSVVAAVSVAIVAVLAFLYLVGTQLPDLARNIVSYQRNIETKVAALQSEGALRGVVNQIGGMVERLGQAATKGDPPPGPAIPEDARPAADPEPLLVRVQPPALGPVELIRTVAMPLLAPLGTAGIVIVFTIFILLQREDLRDRLIRLVGARDLHRTTEALDEAAARVSRYLLMQLVVNVTYGIPIGIGLYLIGVPNALLWGLLAIVLRFVPYIGPMIAASFPILLSFAVDPGWTMPLLTVGLFLGIELISNNIVEPWLYGASTGLSSVAIIVSAVFWTWLWGPVGLLLSTPLTVCLVVMGRYVPQLGFLDVLLGSDPVLPTEARVYQRLLAHDPDEATELAEEYIRQSNLLGLYDRVVMPALCYAEQDRDRGALDRRALASVSEDALHLVEYFADYEEQPEPAARVDYPVLCVAGRSDLDRVAVTMLAQLLTQRGLPARTATFDALFDRNPRADPPVQAICAGFLRGNAVNHAAYMVRRLRRRYPQAKIIVGFWNCQTEDSRRQQDMETVGADSLVTGLEPAVAHIVGMARRNEDRRVATPAVEAGITVGATAARP
ncbi:MAG TPA: AI-2E family transporter [Alphaproteobacteria bacterium]|nr:AI-2E family transporter [Alphaproteobacteria bacterium]